MMKKILLTILLILIIIFGGFFVWSSTPLGPAPDALQALESGDGVQVVKEQSWFLFQPEIGDPRVGFIFYPGGRVDYRSYAPTLRELAAQGNLVALVRMPLNLAVLDAGKAAEVMAAHPEIGIWAVGGHSLGGAMAANYVFKNPGAVAGLVLWAAYPASSNDLSSYDLQVISLYGTQDGVLKWDNLDASHALLPPDTLWSPIEGGNHAGFGSYGAQPGDNPASISAVEQKERVVAQTTAFLAGLVEER
jgi:dienelactone hydrolase